MRGPAIQRLMWSIVVIEIKIIGNPFSNLFDRLPFVQIDTFVFHRSPETFYKDVIESPTFTIHTNCDLMIFQYICEVMAGELRALVRVKYVTLSLGNNPEPIGEKKSSTLRPM